MKKFLLLGAIALMFTCVSCSNDDLVQQESVTTELSAKDDLTPNPNAQQIAYLDHVIAEINQDNERILPWSSIICSGSVTIGGGTIGHEIGYIGGIRVIVTYSILAGTTHVDWGWDFCGAGCGC